MSKLLSCSCKNNNEHSKTTARFPRWLKRPIAYSGKQSSVMKHLKEGELHTVCSEAKCPNRSECFNHGTATFLIMGNVCTRNCSFCGVAHGQPSLPDPSEGERVANAAALMGLRHVVITSVTRDDLYDGGASHFSEVVRCVKERIPTVTVEILIPDFQGDKDALSSVLASAPDILNHNMETVPRLYPRVRPQADYNRSLELLSRSKEISETVRVKSGIMVGLGEMKDEVVALMEDLHRAGCSIITIGQYLRPSKMQLEVWEYISPAQFKEYEKIGYSIGLERVFAAPYVRSSYRADMC